MSTSRHHFTERLRALSDAQAILFLQGVAPETLRLMHAQFVCDCELPRRPCPVHGDCRERCECHVSADDLLPCPRHADSPLSEQVQSWLTRFLFPEVFEEPPPPATRSEALIREVKAWHLAERAAVGRGLWLNGPAGDFLQRRRPGQPDMAEILDSERTVTTRQTNPDAPANGAPVPGELRRRRR